MDALSRHHPIAIPCPPTLAGSGIPNDGCFTRKASRLEFGRSGELITEWVPPWDPYVWFRDIANKVCSTLSFTRHNVEFESL